MVAEVIHGAPYRFADPARFAHGARRQGRPSVSGAAQGLRRDDPGAEIRGRQGAARLDRGARRRSSGSTCRPGRWSGQRAARRCRRSSPRSVGERRSMAGARCLTTSASERAQQAASRNAGLSVRRSAAYGGDDLHFGPLGDECRSASASTCSGCSRRRPAAPAVMARELPMVAALPQAPAADSPYAVRPGAEPGLGTVDVAALL